MMTAQEPIEPNAVDAAPDDPSHGGHARGETGLMRTVSVEALIVKRNLTIERIREAHQLLVDVEDAAKDITDANGLARSRAWCIHLEFSGRGGTFTGDTGVERAIKKIDAGFWAHLLSESRLSSFMDATAREQWRVAIDREDVPTLNKANIEATFTALYKDRGDMFERGVIELFRKLKWDYKTNNPVLLGHRLILDYGVERCKCKGGTGNTDRSLGRRTWTETNGVAHAAADKLDDLIRVMCMLDGYEEPTHDVGAWYTLNNAMWMKRESRINIASLPAHKNKHGDVVKPYFTVKGFKNGNIHLTFAFDGPRGDHVRGLVTQMNKIIAKHYPNALPPADDTDENGQ